MRRIVIFVVSILLCLSVYSDYQYFSSHKETVGIIREIKYTDKHTVVSPNNVKSRVVYEVIEMLKNNSNIKIISYFETAMVFLMVNIVIMIIILNYVEKLFNNIKNEKTPFTLDNVKFIKKISYLMIALILITPISDAVFSIISGVSNGGDSPFEIINVLEILIIFSMSYIFEYGYEIQKDSRGKMYSEENK